MKIIFTILSLLVLTTFAFGQTEKATYKTVADRFEKNFNTDNFDAIYANFSTEMQKGLPIEKTKEFLTGLKQKAGKITNREFLKYNQSFAFYKTNFERGIFAVRISVDDNAKINGLRVGPFEESDQVKFDTPYGYNEAVGKYVKINGAEIYYEEYGKGEPLLLIHGCAGDIQTMENQIEYFKDKYRVIVADSRGQGKSELKTDSLTYDQMTSDWEGLVHHLRLDSINIIGWSDGGIIALKMGISNHTKIKKFVAMAPNLRPDTTAVNSAIIEGLRKQLSTERKMVRSRDWDNNKQLYNLLLQQPSINPSDLKKITAAGLIVVGDRDIIKNEHAVEMFNHLPKGQLCIMPGGNHNAPQNNPEIFNQLANRFLSEPFNYTKK